MPQKVLDGITACIDRYMQRHNGTMPSREHILLEVPDAKGYFG